MYIEGNKKLQNIVGRELRHLEKLIHGDSIYLIEPVLERLKSMGFGVRLEEDDIRVLEERGLDYIVDLCNRSIAMLQESIYSTISKAGFITRNGSNYDSDIEALVTEVFEDDAIFTYLEPKPRTLMKLEQTRLDLQEYFFEGDRRMVNFQIQTNGVNSKTVAALMIQKPITYKEAPMHYRKQDILQLFKDSQQTAKNLFLFNDSLELQIFGKLTITYDDAIDVLLITTPKKMKDSFFGKVCKKTDTDEEDTSFTIYISRSESYSGAKYITSIANQIMKNQGIAKHLDFQDELVVEIPSEDIMSPVSNGIVNEEVASPSIFTDSRDSLLDHPIVDLLGD